MKDLVLRKEYDAERGMVRSEPEQEADEPVMKKEPEKSLVRYIPDIFAQGSVSQTTGMKMKKICIFQFRLQQETDLIMTIRKG